MVQESTKKVEYADSLVWVGQFSSQGFNQVVEQRDVPELRSAEEIKVLTERALELWKRHGRVGKVYWLMHWKFILLGLGICIVHGTLSSFVGILCLWGFVGELAKSQDEVSLSLVGWGTGIVVCVTMNTLLYGYQRQILGGRLATDFVSWGTGLILWKSTRVTQSDENDTDEATLVGADLSRIAEDMLLLGNMASNILQLIGCVSIAFYFTGLVSSLVVVGLLVVAIVAFSFLSAKVHDVEMKSLAVMDYRVNLLRHFVQNLFAVKQSCWEELFLDAIFKARKEESRLIYWFRVFGVSARNMGDVCVVMSASLAIFIMLLGESDIITVQQVFAVSAALWYLRGPFYEIPQQAIKVANILVSVRRFERYLSLDEIDTLPTPENHQDGLLMAAQNAIFSWNRPEPHGALEPIHLEPQEHSVQSVALEMAPTTAQHQEEDIEGERDKHQQHQDDDDKKLASKTFVLDKIDIKVTKGSLVGIVGGLGSGKTALLEAVTGTLCRLSGYVAITDSIGYVSQPPLLFSGTVKENILSGRPLDEDFLRRVVVASGLEPDLQGMAGGLNTYVGDQGRTLSGGQQVRVAFARALYGKPSLLLLDDPLRALDATVASHVFHRGVLCFLGRCNCSSDATLDQNCIRERDGPCSRGVLLALNQGQLIRHFDQIIVLHEGAQVEAGSGEFVLRREGFLAKNNIITTMRDAETNSKTRTAAPTEKETQPPNEQLKENDIVVDSLDEELKEEQGASSFDAFVRYVKEMGIGVFLISLLLGMAGFGATVSGDVSLAFFMTSIDENQVNFSYAYAFLALTLFGGLMIEVVSIYNTSLTQRASSGVHRKALLKIARAPLAWFERNPSGRLLARFSGDLLAVDRLLSDQYDIVFHIVFFLIATIGMIGYIVPELVVVIAVVIISFFLIVLYLDKTDAQVRRIAMQALGPVVGDMAVVASHRSSIRVMQLEQYAEDQTFQHLSEYLSSMYSTNSIVNFGTLLGTVMGLVVSVVFVTFFGVRRTQEDSSHAAVALVYSCFILPQWILIILVALPGILNYLKSLERLLQYTRDSIPQEPPQVLETDESLHNWPVNGTMVFENVSLVYRDGDRPALKDVSMTWESGQRIGCVGTTGAGKSSLVSLIFRIREVTSGRIVLGGHDISKIGIQKVRQVVGGIPQTPLVLPGGLRKNLDPFSQFSADKVEQVLRMIRLDTNWAHLEENEGDSQDAGLREKKMLSLSTGQLQLLSLGRLILRKENIKVVVLDEPTSSSEADEILHHVLQDQFPHATTITIAHRLQSVMSCDKIAVLSKGKLVEFDSPSHLASHPASMFATLLSQYK